MATSTGPILAAGAMVLAADLVEGHGVDWRIVTGTGLAALGLAGLSTVSPRVARGLAMLVLLTATLTRVRPDRPAPVEVLLNQAGLLTPAGDPKGGGQWAR